MLIERDDPARADVRALLAEHLADMHATSPAESVHAPDVAALQVPGVTFWTARRDGLLLGCGALKELDPTHGELKSMRTTTAARGTGVGRAMLLHLIATGRERGFTRLSLETGTQDYFLPARTLYAAHGFIACGPFADYTEDPHSAYFALLL
ncbi:MAG: GNAT family N-acetyltransferase [Marmoricola sp.]